MGFYFSSPPIIFLILIYYHFPFYCQIITVYRTARLEWPVHLSQGFQTWRAYFWAQNSCRDLKSVNKQSNITPEAMPWLMAAVHARISGSYLKTQVGEGGSCRACLCCRLLCSLPYWLSAARRRSRSLVEVALTSWSERACPERGVRRGTVLTLYVFLWGLAPPASPLPSCTACQSEWQSSAGKRSIRGRQLHAFDYQKDFWASGCIFPPQGIC